MLGVIELLEAFEHAAVATIATEARNRRLPEGGSFMRTRWDRRGHAKEDEGKQHERLGSTRRVCAALSEN
jgi:hypothetical protein